MAATKSSGNGRSITWRYLAIVSIALVVSLIGTGAGYWISSIDDLHNHLDKHATEPWHREAGVKFQVIERTLQRIERNVDALKEGQDRQEMTLHDVQSTLKKIAGNS